MPIMQLLVGIFTFLCFSTEAVCIVTKDQLGKRERLKNWLQRDCLKGLNVLHVYLLFDLIPYKQVIPVRDDKF